MLLLSLKYLQSLSSNKFTSLISRFLCISLLISHYSLSPFLHIWLGHSQSILWSKFTNHGSKIRWESQGDRSIMLFSVFSKIVIHNIIWNIVIDMLPGVFSVSFRYDSFTLNSHSPWFPGSFKSIHMDVLCSQTFSRKKKKVRNTRGRYTCLPKDTSEKKIEGVVV